MNHALCSRREVENRIVARACSAVAESERAEAATHAGERFTAIDGKWEFMVQSMNRTSLLPSRACAYCDHAAASLSRPVRKAVARVLSFGVGWRW